MKRIGILSRRSPLGVLVLGGIAASVGFLGLAVPGGATVKKPITCYETTATGVKSSHFKTAGCPTGWLRTAPKGEPTQKAWDALVKKAKQEGSVTLSLPTGGVAPAAAAEFTSLYGIQVNFTNNSPANGYADLTAEETTKKYVTDVYEVQTQLYADEQYQGGFNVPIIAPSAYASDFNRKEFLYENSAIPGTDVLLYAWNSSVIKTPPTSFQSLVTSLSPGQLGLLNIQVSPQPLMVYLQYLEGLYGSSILSTIASAKPQIYQSATACLQAVASGEITACAFAATNLIEPLILSGAPLAYQVYSGYNLPAFLMVMKHAPHPAAAQLWVDFALTHQGEGYLQQFQGADFPGIPGTTLTSTPDVLNLANYTPAEVTTFENNWLAMLAAG